MEKQWHLVDSVIYHALREKAQSRAESTTLSTMNK